MAKTKWNLLFATFILSCVSLTTLIVSLCTQYWVTSEAYESSATKNSEINYGLFTGSLTQNFLSNPRYYDLTLTCLYQEYVCAFSCQKNEENRTDEVLKLLKGLHPAECPDRSSKLLSIGSSPIPNTSFLSRQTSVSVFDRTNFINTGLWVSTVVFIGLAIGFATASASFSIINVLFNPVEPIFNVFGLFIWNGVAIGATALCMIMWGALFAGTLIDNIAITDTLTSQFPYSSAGLAALGVSYWVLFLPILMHGLNVGLLLWRRYIINKEPLPTTIDVDRSDLTIIMF
ncbi:uncharacterized protein LOC126558709 [Anopheles maculipalpis]|uniref:uncharacterized protein LOC126558709 n=1 Tax=Anopheles maculipalpis TaxID=1496333 RepID=UPI002158DEAD|nr:uncharacterized protein LOC126558709 [Anopheles maculipalpis]